jgi:hypothetical protein
MRIVPSREPGTVRREQYGRQDTVRMPPQPYHACTRRVIRCILSAIDRRAGVAPTSEAYPPAAFQEQPGGVLNGLQRVHVYVRAGGVSRRGP